MRLLKLLLLLSMATLAGCDVRMREQELQVKADSLAQKEQQLILLQNELNVQKTDLEAKQHLLDSLLKRYIPPDSVLPQKTFLVGRWSVQMVCTETTCAGSAVGDNKTEMWDIAYQDNTIIAKAMVNNQLVRVYSGNTNENELLLTAQQDTAATKTNITVRLLLKMKQQWKGKEE